jgi:hypothetical protein
MLEFLDKNKAEKYLKLNIDSVFKTHNEGKFKTEWICYSGDKIIYIKYSIGILFISMAEVEYNILDDLVSIAADTRIEIPKNKGEWTNNKINFDQISELFKWKVNCDIFD